MKRSKLRLTLFVAFFCVSLFSKLTPIAKASTSSTQPQLALCSKADLWKTRQLNKQICVPVSSTQNAWLATMTKNSVDDLSSYCLSRIFYYKEDRCPKLVAIANDLLKNNAPDSPCKEVLQGYIERVREYFPKSSYDWSLQQINWLPNAMVYNGCKKGTSKDLPPFAKASASSSSATGQSHPKVTTFVLKEVKTYIRPGGSVYQQYFSYLVNANPNGIIPKSLCLFIDGQPYVGVIGPIAEYPPADSPKQSCVNPSEFAISYKYPGDFGFDFSLKEYPGAIAGDKHEVTMKWEFANKPSITTPPRILVFLANGRWTWTN